MTELPLLTVVTLALPSRLQAIYHILHLINHYLVPSTIDAAVYLNLHRVSNVFGTFRPLTVGAMDGAAARGRLDIIKRLHADRSEGCSTAAFNGAAANNHLAVLRWLLEKWYRRRCNITETLAAGAGAGHLRVVKYIITHVHAPLNVFEDEFVVEAAVLNGQVEILEYLLNVERNGYYRRCAVHVAAVNTAAKNGLTRVMRFLLHNVEWFDVAIHDNYHGLEYAAAAGYSEIVALLLEHGCFTQTSLDISVEKAAEAGHMKVVFMVLPHCGENGACRALAAAVANNYSTLVELLVRFCSPVHVANVAKSTNNDQPKVLELVLPKRAALECLDYPASYTTRRFISAAACGNEQDVKILMRQDTSVSAVCIGYVVEVAAALSQCGVVKLILEEITSRNLHVPDFVGVKPALKRALESNDLTMTSLLTPYCDRYAVGTLLNKCVTRNQVEAVRTLAERSFQFDIAVGAFEACMAGREDVFGVLMEFMEATTALKVLVKLAKAGKLEFVKRGLTNQLKLDQLFAEAVASGRIELVKLLLDEMSRPIIGFALLTAARLGHIEVVKLLFGKGEPWGVQFHALEEAAKAGKANVVDYLRPWCGPVRITAIIADLRASGEEEAAALLDTKRARFE